MINITPEIQSLIDRNALFVVNHSGGKDSQAMMIEITKHVPADQILVIHAHLDGVEWDGTEDHIRATIGDHDLVVTRAVKTFFEMVRRRGMWPSPQYRQCTSDLKRGPIEKAIRHHLKANPQHDGLVVSCTGIRAQESAQRSKQTPWKFSAKNSKAGRQWFEWMPIFDMDVDTVFATIEAAGQKPHWAYDAGMSRLSCCFCIMGSQKDTCIAAKHNPELFQAYADLEREIDQTFFMPRDGKRVFLDELVAQAADLVDDVAQDFETPCAI